VGELASGFQATGFLAGVKWRLVGPFRGGRVVAVAGDASDPLVFYFGSTGGGVWKTRDAGVSWKNVSDGFFARASVGALAIAPSDPTVLYAGMGECCIRSNVSHGDGVYRSTDAGASWTHCGLEQTRHIGRIRVHPANPDLVYVAALGHAHGPNAERGVYRSSDGGNTWGLVLHRGADAGAVDLAIDPNNPRILYASIWQARRLPWSLVSGGPHSGLWRSTDGGDSWIDISRRPGLPAGMLGRIGVTASAPMPGRVWAIIEAEDGAVFRSEDYGDHWDRLSDRVDLRLRAWYYHHICADPCDPETVWALNIDVWRSHDGGRTFDNVSVPHGDSHDLWIDPYNPRRLILGSDGGANVSLDGGVTWSSCYNQPTAELYHVTTDNREPYRIYAAQQDNTTICLPSHSELGAITQVDAYSVGGGESGYIAVRPDNPDIVFGGNYMGELTRYDHQRRSLQWIAVWPYSIYGEGAEAGRYRFNWTSPVLLSPHDHSVLYHGGNRVFRSTDEGRNWTAISPDLSRGDPEKLKRSGGDLTPDNWGAEHYCTIFALAESPLEPGVLWAGSDDGLVHVTRDAGRTWTNVTPPDIPEWALISIIEPSTHEPGLAYLAAERHKLDDFKPYLWRTHDYGAAWERLDSELPDDEFCRVVREDPVRRELIYCGTEAGLYLSFDGGRSWQSLRGNLPVSPIHDIVVRGDDLVAATHGRSIWILADLSAIRQYSLKDEDATVRLYPPRRFVRYPTKSLFTKARGLGRNYANVGLALIAYDLGPRAANEDPEPVLVDAGENAPDGVTVLYWLREDTDDDLQLAFHDSSGNEIRTFTAGEKSAPGLANGPKRNPPNLRRRPGLNRFVWDTRHAIGTLLRSEQPSVDDQQGPLVPPGVYEARLRLGKIVETSKFEIAKDPRNDATEVDLEAQYRLSLKIWQRICDLNRSVNTIRDLKDQLRRWASSESGHYFSSGASGTTSSALVLINQLAEIEEALVTVSPLPPVEKPSVKLDGKLKTHFELSELPNSPTPSMIRVADELFDQLAGWEARIESLIEGPLREFNDLVANSGLPAVGLRGG
jgi:photosystem II stability/assembly factor-like uncharacterized protein